MTPSMDILRELNEEYSSIALRGWTGIRKRSGKRHPGKRPDFQLYIQTEARADAGQAFTYGWAALVHHDWMHDGSGHWQIAASQVQYRVLFYADDLPVTDPAGYATIYEFAQGRQPVRLMSRTEFMEKEFYYHCVWHRTKLSSGKLGRPVGTSTAVFYDAPYSISRLAESWADARTSQRSRSRGDDNSGYFSFRVFPRYKKVTTDPITGAEHIEWQNQPWYPYIRVKVLNSKQAFIEYTGYLDRSTDDDKKLRVNRSDQIFNVKQLVYSLTNEGLSLEQACKAYVVHRAFGTTRVERRGVVSAEHVEDARSELAALITLTVTALNRFYVHPIDLAPSRAFSASSLAKGYLQRMGITAPLDRSEAMNDPILLGRASSAFYGGWSGTPIRLTGVPAALLDITSNYCTINALMGIWQLNTASEIHTVDCTDWLKQFCSGLTAERVLDKSAWPLFPGLVQVETHGEDVWPVRALYETGATAGLYRQGLNYLDSPRPLWFTIPDVINSALITGNVPHIISAVRLVPSNEKLSGLQSVGLLGRTIDPAADDFFRAVVELRQVYKRQAASQGHNPGTCACEVCDRTRLLKVLANAGSYGVYMQMNRRDLTKSREVDVYGAFEPRSIRTRVIDVAAEFTYPPIAAAITGGARLMLGILERLITDAGGTVLYRDTDSTAVVTDSDGSLVPCESGLYMVEGRAAVKALTYDQVNGIRDSLNRLNPYDPATVPQLVKLETPDMTANPDLPELFGCTVSDKRHAWYTLDKDGRSVVPSGYDSEGVYVEPNRGGLAYSEHGLGSYLNPSDMASSDRAWMREAWQWVLDLVANGLEFPGTTPDWFDTVALTKIPASTPASMRIFDRYNEVRPERERVRPLNSVLLVSERPSLFGGPPRRFIAPYTNNPADLLTCEWVDFHHPVEPAVHITTAREVRSGEVAVMSMRNVMLAYVRNKESKSAGANGKACGPMTEGLLFRRLVRVRSDGLRQIGKEISHQEEVENRTVTDPDQITTSYGTVQLADDVSALGSFSDRGLASLELTAYDGAPVSLSHKVANHWKHGIPIDARSAQGLALFAARHVAPSLGVDPDDITPRLVPVVLAAWRDARGPMPNTTDDGRLSCDDGCTKRRHSGACRKRRSRKKSDHVE